MSPCRPRGARTVWRSSLLPSIDAGAEALERSNLLMQILDIISGHAPQVAVVVARTLEFFASILLPFALVFLEKILRDGIARSLVAVVSHQGFSPLSSRVSCWGTGVGRSRARTCCGVMFKPRSRCAFASLRTAARWASAAHGRLCTTTR